MALESFSGIWSLNTSNPVSTDDQNQGDDHIRGIKQTIRETFPNISATVNTTASEINSLVGVSGIVGTRLDALSATVASLVGYGALYVTGNASEVSSTTSLSRFIGWDIPGLSKRTTLSTASGHVAVTYPGIYSVNANLCISASAGAIVTARIYVGDVQSDAQSVFRIAASGYGILSVDGLMSAGASDEICLRLMTNATTSLNITNAQMVVKRAG